MDGGSPPVKEKMKCAEWLTRKCNGKNCIFKMFFFFSDTLLHSNSGVLLGPHQSKVCDKKQQQWNVVLGQHFPEGYSTNGHPQHSKIEVPQSKNHMSTRGEEKLEADAPQSSEPECAKKRKNMQVF